MKTDLLFKNLFARALKDWPKKITFGKLIRYDSSRFSVEGLYDFAEEIEHRYFNHPEEIIMRNMHYCIYGVLHDLAEFSLEVEMQSLRPESMQKGFEDKIKSRLEKTEDLNWDATSFKLVQDYFTVNYPDKK